MTKPSKQAAARLVAGFMLAFACGLAAAEDPLMAAPAADAARPGLGSVLREWRQDLAQRLHFRAAPEPAVTLLRLTHLRMKLEGDAELAVRLVGGLQVTLRSTF